MQSLKPKVTVILTSYNHSKFIREAIESVLNQTFTDFELIIWDDVSTDDSWEIICSYKDERIRAFQNEVNQRKVVNTVLLSGEIRGKYVAIHHSDDVWEPEKLEKQIAYLENNPEAGAVFTKVSIIDEQGAPFADTQHFYYSIFDQPNRTRHEWLRFFTIHGNALCHPSLLIRKECYDKLGVYNYSMAQLPDFDMWVRLAMRYEIHVLDEKLVKFRILDNEHNTSGNRPDVHIRTHFEFHQVFQTFKQFNSNKELLKVFPEADAYLNEKVIDVHYALGRVLLDLSPIPGVKLFALELLAEAIEHPIRRKALLEASGFTPRKFYELSAKYDIFSVVEKANLHQRFYRFLTGELVISSIYLFDENEQLIQQVATEIWIKGSQPMQIVFNLDENIQFYSFGWDPIEGFPCRVITHQVDINFPIQGWVKIDPLPQRHNGNLTGNAINYFTTDPRQNYYCKGPAKEISITASIEQMHPIEVENFKNIQLYEKDAEIAKSYTLLNQYKEKSEEQITTLNELTAELSASVNYSLQQIDFLKNQIEKADASLSYSNLQVESLNKQLAEKEKIILENVRISNEQMNQLNDIKAENAILSFNLTQLLNSWSWKITSPLRWIKKKFR